MDRPAGPLRRAGYVITVTVNGVLLWVTVPFVAGIVICCIDDSIRVKGPGEVVTAIIGLVVAVRTWQVHPFEFSSSAHDWGWLVRTLLVVAIVGSAAGTIAALVKLASPTPRHGESAPRRSAD